MTVTGGGGGGGGVGDGDGEGDGDGDGDGEGDGDGLGGGGGGGGSTCAGIGVRPFGTLIFGAFASSTTTVDAGSTVPVVSDEPAVARPMKSAAANAPAASSTASGRNRRAVIVPAAS